MVHAPGIADHPGTTLCSVWARRPEAARALAGRFGAEVADDVDELLESVDAVAFAVPPAVQAEIAIRAARAGKHLVLEKPIAATLEDAQTLADAVRDAGVASLVVLTRRYAPETKELLAQLQRTGGWTGADARWLNGGILAGPFADSPWRHDRGALDDVGPHVFDLLDAAVGPITGVLAANRSATGLWQVIVEHESGATSTASLSLTLPIQPPIAELTVYGEHGARSLPRGDTSAQDCFAALLDDFVAMVGSGTTEHPLDVRRGLHLQRVIALARERAGA
jgi:predicted dehydrogenase